ncbi:MAG: hypothetical protein BWX83_01078 [Candidatus Cloacimonetes bacterium ADurb.Bin117]|nr:MAG: hypothetical protein BWX83_01078 [Candidatus Cloacimonetes bacterium ADurb.Bin117]
MENLQPILSPRNGCLSDLELTLSPCGGEVLVFLAHLLLERVKLSADSLQYKMLMGRLRNAGWRGKQLQKVFGHDPRTIKAWGDALLSDDPDVLAAAFGGRGHHGKLFPALVRYVQIRYGQLSGERRDYSRTIGAEVVKLFDVTLSRETLRRLFRDADECAKATVPNAPEVATGCVSRPFSSLENMEPSRNQSTFSPDAGSVPVFAKIKEISGGCWVGLHHVGLVLFFFIWEVLRRDRRSGDVNFQNQLIAQVLQGAVNIEQSRLVTPHSLSCLVGPPVTGIRWQRENLKAMACPKTVLDIYAANARLVPDGPGRYRTFYYDPHSKEYTGSLKLLKDWCGRRHGTAKVLHIDMIHSRSGRPCFAQHYSPYYNLRERFFMTLDLFNRLFDPADCQGRLFVLDRGIYGVEVFDRFTRDFVLTWEKDYQGDGWDGHEPQVVFTRQRTRNHAGDLREYTFACREEPWRRRPGIRRMLVQATNPEGNTIRVSVLCSDPDISLEDAVWAIFNRWLQENSFKYLDRHFGLNQITSYAWKPAETEADDLRDMPVDSPEYRELKDKLHQLEAVLARELLKREKLQDRLAAAEKLLANLKKRKPGLIRALMAKIARLKNAGAAHSPSTNHEDGADQNLRQTKELNRNIPSLRAQLGKVELRIQPLKAEAEGLNRQLCDALRNQSRMQLLIDQHYRFLDTRCKETMDALRITAANAFAELADIFRPIYGNHRNDHVMLRNLTRSDGFVRVADGLMEVRFWLKGRYQKHQLDKFQDFLDAIAAKSSIPLRLSIGIKPPTI